MKTWRWIGCAAGIVVLAGAARSADLELPRPGAILVTQATGTVFAAVADQRKTVKVDDRLRVGSIVSTERRSYVTLMLSNGVTLELGSDTEIEFEEFGQASVSGSLKIPELKEEPTLSRTRLRLGRGDVSVDVKPLKVSRGSSFTLTLPPGTVRVANGTFRAMVQMSDLGVGVCTVELQKGAAEFQLLGSTGFAPVPLGSKLAFAIEVDKATGAVKVGEMPKETAPAKK